MKDILGDKFERSLDEVSKEQSFKIVRKKRPVERGLLLIYPLYTHHNLPEVELDALRKDGSKSPIISESEVVYSIAMVLPFSQVTDITFNYRENVTVTRQR